MSRTISWAAREVKAGSANTVDEVTNGTETDVFAMIACVAHVRAVALRWLLSPLGRAMLRD